MLIREDRNLVKQSDQSDLINEAIKIVEYRRLDSGSTTGEPRVAGCLSVLRELRREIAIEEKADRDEDAPAYAGV